MPDAPLLSVSQFTGDDDELLLISPDEVIAGYVQINSPMPQFIQNIVGCDCAASAKTVAEHMRDSVIAGESIQNPGPLIGACTWFNYYKPMAFAGSFGDYTAGALRSFGWWQLSGNYIIYNPLDPTTVDPETGCYHYTTIDYQSRYYGWEPNIHFEEPPYDLCGLQTVCSFLDDLGHVIPGPPTASFGASIFIEGSGFIIPIGREDDGSSNPTGAFYMPLPPIPTEFPTPPLMAGCSANVTADDISVDEARAIVDKGIWPWTWFWLASIFPDMTPEEQLFVHAQMQLPTARNPNELRAVAEALTDEEALDLVQKLVIRTFAQMTTPGTVTIERNIETRIIFGITPAGKIFQILEIAAELIERLLMLLTTLEVPQCVGPEQYGMGGTLQMVEIPFPVQTIDGVSTKAGFQAVCDALFSLLRCCPPCVTDVWHGPDLLDDVLDWESMAEAPPGSGIYQRALIACIMFEVTEIKYQEHAMMGEQEKLGYFKWLVFDTFNEPAKEWGQPIWVNTDGAVFFTPNGLIRGIRWVPQAGVKVNLFWKWPDRKMALTRLGPP